MSQYGQGGYGQSGYGQSGNRYDQQAGGNPYAQQQQGSGNPYDQRAPTQDNRYGQQPQQAPQQQYASHYTQQPSAAQRDYAQAYNAPAANAYNGANDIEMGAMNGGAGPRANDPMAILNETRDIDRGIDTINGNLERLQFLQQRSLDDPDTSASTTTNREMDALSAETMTMYRSFVARMKKLKATPGAGSDQNKTQLGRTDRRLKEAIQRYQTVDAEFRKKLQQQMARQYRIVRPEASDAEVREAVEDTSQQQVFSQALMQDRRGQSQSALRAVQGRHEAIQKIEQQVIELAQLFQDLNVLIVEQEAPVARIDEQAGNVVNDVTQGNVQLDGAIDRARARNRKKWYCLGIVVLIIIIIIVVVLAVLGAQGRL